MPPLTARDRRIIAGRAIVAAGRARQVRLAARLSLLDMARMSASSEAGISRWERDQRRPTSRSGLRYLELLARLDEQATR